MPQPSLSTYHPSLGERLQQGIASGLSGLGVDPRYANHLGQRLFGAVNDLTPVGNATMAADAGTAIRNGHPFRGLGMGALAVLPGAAGKVGKGMFGRRALGKFDEFMREGNERYLTYTSHDGQVANMQLIIGPDGMAEISIDPFSRDANRFGPAQLREGSLMLRQMYPEIKGFWGERLTGAGPGRIQKMKVR